MDAIEHSPQRHFSITRQQSAISQLSKDMMQRIMPFLSYQESAISIPTINRYFFQMFQKNERFLEVLYIFKKAHRDLAELDAEKYTLATRAAKYGKQSIADRLLEENIDFNQEDGLGNLPIVLAAQYGHVNIIHSLASRVDFHKIAKYGYTALTKAVESGQVGILHALKKHNVDFSQVDGMEYTAATLSAVCGRVQVCLELKRLGVKFSTQDGEQHTPATRAAEHRQIKILQMLAKKMKVNLNTQNGKGETPATIAVKEGSLGGIKKLSELYVNLDLPNGNEETPLFIAVQQEFFTIVNFLIKQGVTVDTRSFFLAIAQGSLLLVDALAKKIPKNEAVMVDGYTPATWAAQKGHTSIVKILHKQNFSIFRKDLEKRTIISIAIENEDIRLLKFLYEEKVDMNDLDNGYSIATLAAEKGKKKVFEFLTEINLLNFCKCDARGFLPATQAAFSNKSKILRFFFENDIISLDMADERGYTPATTAAEQRHHAVIETLISCNVSMFDMDENGNTPMNFIAQNGNLVLLEILAEYDSNLLIVPCNKKGYTPSTKASLCGHMRFIQTLHDLGVDLKSKDRLGYTPMEVAVMHKQKHVITTLQSIFQPSRLIKNI